MIVDYSLGQPGSVHDAYAFRSTRLYEEHANLLPDDHWVWADSAYPLEPWCIPPFKKPRNGRLTKDQRTFNYHLSKVFLFSAFLLLLMNLKIRVRVEHTFAVLKGRFQSLRELRINIQTEKDLQVAVHWIKCCLILHNMIICFETRRRKQDKDYDQSLEWARTEGEAFVPQEIEDPEGNETVGDRSYEGTPGQATRARLMDQLFDSPRSKAQRREG
jgi:hypothetical protein